MFLGRDSHLLPSEIKWLQSPSTHANYLRRVLGISKQLHDDNGDKHDDDNGRNDDDDKHEQWTQYGNNYYQNLMNATNNRLECINQKLKSVIAH